MRSCVRIYPWGLTPGGVGQPWMSGTAAGDPDVVGGKSPECGWLSFSGLDHGSAFNYLITLLAFDARTEKAIVNRL